MGNLPSKTHIQLSMDWDGTITQSDTITALARIGYKANEREKFETRPWAGIVTAYVHDMVSHKAKYEPTEKERKTVDEEYQYLVGLKKIELASARRRVAQGGVFENVTAADLDTGAKEALDTKKVRLRPGWERLFSFGTADGIPRVSVSVVSANWSATFIRNCLRHGATALGLENLSFEAPHKYETRTSSTSEGSPDGDDVILKGLELYANEVHKKLMDPEVPEIKEFYDVWAMHTSSNKLLGGFHMAGQKAMDRAHVDRNDLITVYVGDSMGDFHCLLAADIGICIRDKPEGKDGTPRGGQKELVDTLHRVGIKVKELKHLRHICTKIDYQEYETTARKLVDELMQQSMPRPFVFEGEEMLPENAAPTEEFQNIAALDLKFKTEMVQADEWRGVYWTCSLHEIAELVEEVLSPLTESSVKQELATLENEGETLPEDLTQQQILEHHRRAKEARRTFHCHHDGCIYAPNGLKRGFSSQYNLARHLKGAHSVRQAQL